MNLSQVLVIVTLMATLGLRGKEYNMSWFSNDPIEKSPSETPASKGFFESDPIEQDSPQSQGEVIKAYPPALERGDKDNGEGGIISKVQSALSSLGLYSGDNDGVVGNKTIAGVQDYQAQAGFDRTGVIDEGTLDGILSTPASDRIDSINIPSTLGSTPTPDVAPVGDTTPAAAPVAVSTTVFATITKDGTSTTVDITTPLTNGFDSLTLAEGTNIHLDGRGFVTLPHGIVPDANSIKKGDGTAFDPTGRHGLKTGNLASVDYSDATKYNISRADYTSDEAWAKAVYSEFGQRTATEYGTGFEDLTDTAKQAAYDMTWNAGIGAASWSSVQTMLTEASKDSDEDKTSDNLIGFTTNFKSGTEKVNGKVINNYPRGLLKRRAQTYNLVAKDGEEAATITTTSTMVNGVRTGTKYDIKKEDGTVIKSWTKPDLNERLGDLEV